MEPLGSKNHPSRQGLDRVAVICLVAAALAGIAAAVVSGAAEFLPLTLAVAGAVGGVVIAVYYLIIRAEWREKGSWIGLIVYPLLGALILYILGWVLYFAIERVLS